MKILRSYIVIFLSLMVFITSSGLTVNLHYCSGHLQNISVKQLDADCGIKIPTKTENCNRKSQKSTLKNIDSCCQNHQIKAKTDTKITLQKSKDDNSFLKNFTFIQTYFISLFSFDQNPKSNNQKEKDISLVPILKEGLYILLQQFRN